MLKEGECRTDVCDVTGIDRARRAIQLRHWQRRGSRRPVEVEPRVQQTIAGDPARAKRNLVERSIVHGLAASQRRLDVIVHVLLRATGDDMQNVVASVVRIGFDRAALMVPEHPPARQTILKGRYQRYKKPDPFKNSEF